MTGARGDGVVVVGSVNADLMLRVDRHPAPGETLLGSGGELTAGGKGANQAVAAARQGAATSLVGAVGDDHAAAAATAVLRSSGVDLSRLVTVPGPTGLAVVTVSRTGENTIVVVPGANAAVSREQIDRSADQVEDAAVCLLQGELPADSTAHAVRLAAEAGVRVVLNLAPVMALPADVVGLADPLVVNEHEARLTLEMLQLDAPPGEDDIVSGATALASSLVATMARSVVVTIGADGAVITARDTRPTHVRAPRVAVRDTTGAGDAFVGALAARLVAGSSLDAAAEHAVRVGAYAVQSAGAQPSFPTREDSLP